MRVYYYHRIFCLLVGTCTALLLALLKCIASQKGTMLAICQTHSMVIFMWQGKIVKTEEEWRKKVNAKNMIMLKQVW